MNSIIPIGPLNVKIVGENALSNLIKEELIEENQNNKVDADIELDIDSKKIFDSYKPTHYSGKDAMNFNKSEYYVGYLEYLNYIVQNPFEKGKISLHIQLKEQSMTSRAKKKILSLKKVEYSDINRLIRSFILSYAVFWNVFQLGLLKKNCSFIHGSTLQKNQSGFLLTGTGGSGKTSIAMQLLKEQDIKYLTEDFGIIRSDGITFYNPKAISLYRTDIDRGNPFATKAIENLSPEMKRKWKLLTSISSKNQLLKIPPSSFLGDNKIGKSCSLKSVIYLTRENCNFISFEELSINEFSERAAQASLVELKSLSEVLRRIKANSPLDYPYKSDFEIYQMMIDIYQNAFSKSNRYMVHIPRKETSDSVSQFLIDNQLIEV